jgi:hypothetical protein
MSSPRITREIPRQTQPVTSRGPTSVRHSRTKRRKNPMHGLCGLGQYIESTHRDMAFHDDRRRHNEQGRDAAMVAAFDVAQIKKLA